MRLVECQMNWMVPGRRYWIITTQNL